MTDTDRLNPQAGSTSGRRGRRSNRRYIRQFLRQIATLLNAGISVDRAMDLLSRQHDAPAVAMIAGGMARRIRQGAALSDAMVAEGKMFDDLDISVVTAAETSGRLAEATARLADYHERRDSVADRIRAALIYPVILVLAAALAVTMLFVVVVPGIAPLLAGADTELPAATRAVLAISEFLRTHGWTIPAVLLTLLLASALPGGRRTQDRLGLTLPLIGRLWSSIETERWQRGLGILLANGVPLPRAVQIAADGFTNLTLKASGAHIAAAIPQGRGLAVLMAESGCFQTIAVQLARVGEETGALDTMLLQAADHQREDVEQTLTRLIGLIEPVLILALGGAIAGVVLALLTTVTSLNETLVGV